MTTEELDALPAGTLLYLPTETEVTVWQYAGKVPGRNFYTVLHPPDVDGTINNRRPVYIDAVQMLHATLDEQAAWLQVIAWMEERKEWIYKRKLTNGNAHQPALSGSSTG